MTEQLDLFGAAAPRTTTPNPRPRRGTHPARHVAGRKHWRAVRATWCRTCRRPILAGLDADECALDTRVDLEPLGPLGEAMALLEGRTTFTLRRDIARGIVLLERRRASAITRRPAGGTTSIEALGWEVHAEHTCSPPALDPLCAPPTITAPPTPIRAHDRPPF